MRSIEITCAGDLSIANQLAEMHRWLDREGIRAIELRAVRILGARVIFSATFAQSADADRFSRAFSGKTFMKRSVEEMQSLQDQLGSLIGTGIIVWMNHPEQKMFNGQLTEVKSDHLSILVTDKTYWIPYHAISAVRSI
jgi:hypothetical protein